MALLDDILDFSQVEAERLELANIEFSLRHCVQGAVVTSGGYAREKGVRLQAEIGAAVPDRLVGDPDALRKVLLKTIHGVVQASAAGRLTVRVRIDDEGAQRNSDTIPLVPLLFSVSNDRGVSSDLWSAVTEPLRQSELSAARKYGGTALGMSLSGRLVRLMGGRIWMEGDGERSSRICFTALFEPDRSAAAQATSEGARPGEASDGVPRILLVEDNRVNQKVTVIMLEKRGFHTLVANHGIEALEVLQSQDVDLVLMDVQMPEMDGLEATRRIRDSEKGTGRHLPVLALTANAQASDRQKCLAAGMDGYLSKPVHCNQLYRLIDDLLARHRERMPQLAS
jgi:CheY-like chemotaxis protein